METLKRPIDYDVGLCISYRMRTENEQFIITKGIVSKSYFRGDKEVRTFYPQDREEPSFLISSDPFEVRRGIAWMPTTNWDSMRIIKNFYEVKTEERNKCLHYLDMLTKQLAFLDPSFRSSYIVGCKEEKC